MTRVFWVMIAFSLVCILAGVAVGFFGPSLFPAKPRPPAAAPQLGKPPPGG
jgi:hypothetical protein